MPKGTLLYGNNSADAGAASEFIAKLLHAATSIHMHHLTVEGPGSHAKHTALGMYDDLVKAADGLAESWMGCTGGKLTFKSGSFEMGSDPVAEVKKVYEYVESNRAMMGAESHIQNDIDGICTLLSTTIYKLEKLA